ncbi:hypothetical protein [Winogradskyella vidalii]|uniref:hypothetical protein n=1 Tax=Winogradskyella vidalii TaxID=2615024 RepID=UPI0015C7752F|nr:hypothetical protein [Winogradskyella vidalii]
MDNSTQFLFYIGQFISGLSTFIVFIATIILFIKKRTFATWLILIGYFLVVLTYTSSLFINVIASRGSFEDVLMVQGVSNIIQALSYFIFAVGLILLAITEFSKNKSISK